jgi:hypothetical protein
MNFGASLRYVSTSYRFFLAHIAAFACLAMPWSILAGLTALLHKEVLLIFAYLILARMGTARICVGWCRSILLGERLLSPHNFGRREWQFLRLLLIPPAMMGAVYALVSLVSTGRAGSANTLAGWMGGYPFDLAFALVWVVAFVPLAWVFPAIAVDSRDATIGQSFQKARSVAGPLFLGLLIASLPMVAGYLVGKRFDAEAMFGNHEWVAVVELALITITAYVSDVVIAGYASFFYRSPKPSDDARLPHGA